MIDSLSACSNRVRNPLRVPSPEKKQPGLQRIGCQRFTICSLAVLSTRSSTRSHSHIASSALRIPLAARFNTCFSLLPDGKILQPSVSERLWKRECMAERFPCRQRRSPIFGSTKVVSPLLTSERNAQLVI